MNATAAAKEQPVNKTLKNAAILLRIDVYLKER